MSYCCGSAFHWWQKVVFAFKNQPSPKRFAKNSIMSIDYSSPALQSNIATRPLYVKPFCVMPFLDLSTHSSSPKIGWQADTWKICFLCQGIIGYCRSYDMVIFILLGLKGKVAAHLPIWIGLSCAWGLLQDTSWCSASLSSFPGLSKPLKDWARDLARKNGTFGHSIVGSSGCIEVGNCDSRGSARCASKAIAASNGLEFTDGGFGLGDRQNPEVKNLVKRSPGLLTAADTCSTKSDTQRSRKKKKNSQHISKCSFSILI